MFGKNISLKVVDSNEIIHGTLISKDSVMMFVTVCDVIVSKIRVLSLVVTLCSGVKSLSYLMKFPCRLHVDLNCHVPVMVSNSTFFGFPVVVLFIK